MPKAHEPGIDCVSPQQPLQHHGKQLFRISFQLWHLCNAVTTLLPQDLHSLHLTMAFTIWSISWSADGDSIFEVLDLSRGLSSRVIMNFQHFEDTGLVQECGVVNGLKTFVHIGIWFRNPRGATKTLGNTVTTGYAMCKNSVWYGILSRDLIIGNRTSWQRILITNSLKTSRIWPRTCSISSIQPTDLNTALEVGLARFRGPTVTSNAIYSKLSVGRTRM